MIPRGFAGRCLGWLRVQIYRWVVLCLLDGIGGVRVAWVWRLLMDQVDLMDLMDKMGGVM